MEVYRAQAPEVRYTVRSNLATLSLLEGLPDMPDPNLHRELVAAVLRRLERVEAALT